MIINETLARGLKDRFFYDFSTEISGAFHKELQSMSLRSIKRGKWVKAARACVDRVERFSIASYEGGSKVKPYFVITVLEVLGSREYNTWNEKRLYSQQLLLAFDPAHVDCRWGHFNIGEHAIVRLFMRSPVQEDAQGNLLPYSIVKQLRYVPFWSTFWIWFHMMTRQIDFLASGPPAGPGGTLLRSLSTAGRSPHALRDLLSIVIPAPDGVFVAHLSKTENAVEVRTFIDSKSLNTDRKAIRDLMIQVSEPPLESPLSASPAVEFANLDYGNAFLTPVLCRRLAPHSDLLARCLFRQADEADHSYRGTPVREVQQWFQQQLSLLAGKADPYWEMFENAPLREFLTQANHILRQSYAAKTAPGKA